MGGPFLTARWESLLLLNFDCPERFLAPLVPAGTELDPWHGQHVVSLVGFRFLETRVKGVPIPGHRDFTEVNLRFYVCRRRAPGGVRRAVVFVREVVPRPAIAWIARHLYNEPYSTASMSEDIRLSPNSGGILKYEWALEGESHTLQGRVEGPAETLTPGSEAEFITEHYWGYTRQRDGSTLEYRVEHPPWRVWNCQDAVYQTSPGAKLYGSGFGALLAGSPRSCFVAEGSEVAVHPGLRTGAD